MSVCEQTTLDQSWEKPKISRKTTHQKIKPNNCQHPNEVNLQEKKKTKPNSFQKQPSQDRHVLIKIRLPMARWCTIICIRLEQLVIIMVVHSRVRVNKNHQINQQHPSLPPPPQPPPKNKNHQKHTFVDSSNYTHHQVAFKPATHYRIPFIPYFWAHTTAMIVYWRLIFFYFIFWHFYFENQKNTSKNLKLKVWRESFGFSKFVWEYLELRLSESGCMVCVYERMCMFG